MKMGIMKKVLATTFATVLVIGTFSACGKETASIADDATPTSSAIDAKSVFTKGVYVTYPESEKDNPDLTQFYVFFGDGSGSIEDGANGTANYFEYEAGEDTWNKEMYNLAVKEKETLLKIVGPEINVK